MPEYLAMSIHTLSTHQASEGQSAETAIRVFKPGDLVHRYRNNGDLEYPWVVDENGYIFRANNYHGEILVKKLLRDAQGELEDLMDLAYSKQGEGGFEDGINQKIDDFVTKHALSEHIAEGIRTAVRGVIETGALPLPKSDNGSATFLEMKDCILKERKKYVRGPESVSNSPRADSIISDDIRIKVLDCFLAAEGAKAIDLRGQIYVDWIDNPAFSRRIAKWLISKTSDLDIFEYANLWDILSPAEFQENFERLIAYFYSQDENIPLVKILFHLKKYFEETIRRLRIAMDAYQTKYGLNTKRNKERDGKMNLYMINAVGELYDKYDLVVGVANGGINMASLFEIYGVETRYIEWHSGTGDPKRWKRDPVWRNIGFDRRKVKEAKRILVCENDAMTGQTLSKVVEFLGEKFDPEVVDVCFELDSETNNNAGEIPGVNKHFCTQDLPGPNVMDHLETMKHVLE